MGAHEEHSMEISLHVLQGDITRLDVDAVVNAANSSLYGGGGVDGAIHRAAGPELLEECRNIRRDLLPDGLPTGEAVLTEGYGLKARYIIHTVGPVWQGGSADEDLLLRQAYLNCLRIAREQEGIESIAFPGISTGVYGYPLCESVEVVSELLKEYRGTYSSPTQIMMCCYSSRDYQAYLATGLFTP